MTHFSLKQAFWAIVLIIVLLCALLGGLLRLEAAGRGPLTPRHAQQLAWYCPPPPIVC